MQDFQQRMAKWRELERLARDLESKLQGAQLGSSPEVARLAREAQVARKMADEYLGEVLGLSKTNPGGRPPGK